MERTATHYRVRDYGVDFTGKLVRRLPVLWQGNCHGNGFKGLTLRFNSRQEPSMTLVLAAVHIEVMREKNVPLP